MARSDGLDYFRDVLDSLACGDFVTDTTGRLVYYNEGAARLWGHPPALGGNDRQHPFQLSLPDGTPLTEGKYLLTALTAGRDLNGIEAIAERPDGTRVRLRLYPTPLRDPAGDVIGSVITLVEAPGSASADYASQRLIAIIESSDDAIIGKDVNGIIQSWNRGAERLFGYTAEEAIGKPVTILIPPERWDEEAIILGRIRRGERTDHYETIRRHKDGSLLHISLTSSPIKDDAGRIVGASKIARDITERKRTLELLQQRTVRLETLNRISKILSSELDLDRLIQSVTDFATDLSGAQFGAFLYNVAANGDESFMLYALSGAPREAFEKWGRPRNAKLFSPTFRGTGIVRSDDIRSDPRYGMNPPYHGVPEGHLPVASYLAVPVIFRSGEVIGGLFFGHEQPGIFTQETQDLVAGIVGHAAVAIENARLHQAAQTEIEQRRLAEETKELLLDEMKHRVKNTLATVQSIASQTFRRATREERDSFAARLQTLSSAHDLLSDRNWDRASVDDVVQRSLAPFRELYRERFHVQGDASSLDARKSLLLAMSLHELATNAVKYGALSDASGHVSLTWSQFQRDGRHHLALSWTESGGPPVRTPRRKGFGSLLIERLFESEQGRASLDFNPQGLTCSLELPL